MALEELLFGPPNSLIHQSYKARERAELLNGDGFGVGWYAPGADPTPCLFTSVTPAWGNQNLRRLAGHVRSPCFFAHVRAASAGMRVSEENCHPFQCGPYLWMHNGAIGEFAKIKRRLRASLDDTAYESIQGTTDSEHAFAVFLTLVRDGHPDSASALDGALVETIRRLERWSGMKFVLSGGRTRMVNGSPDEPSVIVSSERLTEDRPGWTRVAPNHVLTVSGQFEVSVDLVRM